MEIRTEIIDVTPGIGDIIKVDCRKTSGTLVNSDWDKAQFRLTGQIADVAVNVVVTGRTLRRGAGSVDWVRVRVEFVGDGEPSSFSGGWMKI
jgi:hypothetical protein